MILIKNSIIAISCLAIILGISACEREVHLNLSTGTPKVVVEGRIDNGYPPFVTLTSSIGFFDTVDFSSLQNYFIHNADIKVSDGTTTVSLKEYALDTGNHSKFYIYSLDTSSPGALSFTGQVGKFYTLTINYNGQTYTSVTKIPEPIKIDSIRSQPPAFVPKDYPNAIDLVVYFKDPDTLGNYARYSTKRNSEPFYTGDLYSDQITNGIAVNWHIHPGKNTAQPDSVKNSYFFKGDTVTVAWSSIDKGVYTFWNTFQYAADQVGNPFSSPINSESNISNGAVGVWAGYGTTQSTFIIPK